MCKVTQWLSVIAALVNHAAVTMQPRTSAVGDAPNSLRSHVAPSHRPLAKLIDYGNIISYVYEANERRRGLCAVTATMLALAEGQGQALTPRQYAELKGLCLATAYNHLWTGKVPGKQYLGRWLIFLPKAATPEQERTASA
jgi:hypothetical protein